MIPATSARVPQHTAEHVNEQIRQRTQESLRHYANHPEQIDRRLRELDEEWDIERALETNAATLALGGSLLGFFVDRRFMLIPIGVTAFLLQHAVQGWCPPLPILRRMGYRTQTEIEAERHGLKAIRGDYGQGAPGQGEADLALAAISY